MRRVLVLALLLAACATKYGPIERSRAGGYWSSPIGVDAFEVGFAANGYTDPQQAMDFAMLRAAELAIRSGYDRFVVTAVQGASEYGAVTMPTHTSGTATTYGNTTYISMTTTGGGSVPYEKPGVVLQIRGLRPGAPVGTGQAYTAIALHNQIVAKYGVKKP